MEQAKVRKVIGIFSLFLLAFVLTGCSSIEKTENGVKTTNNQIITDDVSYIEKDSEITIHRNKISKVATIDMAYKIKNEDEYADFLGTKMTMVPMLFNLTCSAFTAGIFEPEQSTQSTSTDEAKIDDKMKGYLTGYTPKKISIKFIDAEDGQDIAYCESEQAGSQNIKVKITRDYTNVASFFGVKMGDFNTKK